MAKPPKAHKQSLQMPIRAHFSDNAYSAAIALLNAIENAGSTDYDAVTKALRTKPMWNTARKALPSTIVVMPSVSVFPCTRSKTVQYVELK
jgi:hypothetical protein